VLRHGVGQTAALSTATMALSAPPAVPAAREIDVEFLGINGVTAGPPMTADALTSLGRAIDDLLAQAQAPKPAGVCDARFGLEVVRVLAAAEQALAGGRPVALS
jgi:hypothetical protein